MGSYAGHRIQALIPNKEYEVFKTIANEQHRSVANLAAAILVDWIRAQETLKGESSGATGATKKPN